MEEEQDGEDMLALPDVSTDEQLAIYYLIRTDNGEYAYHITSSRNNKGRIGSSIYTEQKDSNYWFYFKQGSEEEKYVIYNYATGKPAVKDNNTRVFVVSKDAATCELTISPDEQGVGLNFATAEGCWYMTGSTQVVEVNESKSTTWKLQRVSTALLDDPSNNIEKEMASTLMVHAGEGVVTISGLNRGDVVNVYDLVGKLIATTSATEETVVIGVDSKEKMVIVTAGKHYAKVLIK